MSTEPGDQTECRCGTLIEWRLRPMLPFPDVARPEQLIRQGKGRWVHVMASGSDTSNEWCPPQRAYPA